MFNNQMYEIVEFNYLKLDLKNKVSGQMKTICPFCRENRTNKRDKSLSVNITTGVYNCHYCGKTGNIHKWRKIGARKNYVKPVWTNKTELSDKLVKWFEGRGISQGTLNKMRVTEEKEWMPQTEKEENCVVFNYFYENVLINKKFRDGRKNFKLVKDAEKILYNIDSVLETGNKKMIICEGCIDALSYIESGINFAVSVPNGANTNTDYLDNYMPLFDGIEEVYLATDNDTKGLQLREELLRRFGAGRCYKVDFEDCKDANEYLIKYGKIPLLNTISKAQKFPIEGIIRISDIEDELNDMYENGIGEGFRIGDKYIDEQFRLELGRLMVITAIPSHGKTTIMNYITALTNFNIGWKIGYFSPESQPIKLHVSKIEQLLIGKRFRGENRMTLEEHQMAMQYMNDNFYFIQPEKRTLDNILDIAGQAVKNLGLKVVVIDPWNRLEGMSSDTDDIGNELNKVSNFALDNNILAIVVAHPKKMTKDKKSLLYDEPTPYDIKGSSCWYDKPDYILTYYTDFNTMTSRLRLYKLRESHLGKMGTITKFKYNINNERFSCIEDVNGMPVNLQWDNTNWLTGEGKIERDISDREYLNSIKFNPPENKEKYNYDNPPF
jgi:twinkle protein